MNLSIIIPVYNAENTIVKLLDSICSQITVEYEVICVNDGSWDNSASIIKEYSLSQTQVKLISQVNAGVSHARNVGIQASKGEYILFADSDDWYVEGGLHFAVQTLEKNKQADILLFNYMEYSDETSFFCRGMQMDIESLPIKQFLKEGFSMDDFLYMHSVCNKIYKRECIEQSYVFDVKISVGEDAIFNYGCYKKMHKVAVFSKPIYAYKKYGGGYLRREAARRWPSCGMSI